MARRSSQELWTKGEALERSGDATGAIGLFVQAALLEQESGRPLRARLLWEQLGQRTGPTASLLEQLATCAERARLTDEAFHYWVAATARHRAEGRPDDAARTAVHATRLRARIPPDTLPPPLAAQALEGLRDTIADLLPPGPPSGS